MTLYHYSEEPAIAEFVPRMSRRGEPLIWTIDEWHSPIYWLPRDCPRVTFWPLPHTSPADLERWWSNVAGRIVIAIEADWLDRVRTCQLYRYSFAEESFEPLHDHGCHVSRVTLRPLAVEPMSDLLACLAAAGVELRICQSLVPLGQAIRATSLHWSLIRMRNAAGWPHP